ncbi:Diadenosine tetraphosphate (Ap4A) hydrolase [Pseudomonas reinekei]|jgi:diadenosine tetraphosphate (Ap4A) HIT family hydrolase|uniref:Diadenosine tetraphosphate (Ap4A) hydrolase n=1 Tax=Pseudomonas reinekei TaxID=395598 RepID=A0A1H0HC69_PSERE|nr:HIT family protein [Pseudomonas reinekei]KAB0488775.1 HIT family protein [Pseudomonas reinekei]OLU06272.1 HIT family protein [Pseudomonas reinekei]SDO16728.1 Diadenosine tetraphosphate (Ap4A) hydrolase [Pseudomonas reinekei]
MEISTQFIIHETDHWIVNHHMSSALPGYLVLGSRAHVHSLGDLPCDALMELGTLLATVQTILQLQMNPKWLYISRFGHDPGYSIHFHFIPVYHWVEELFWNDARYRFLNTLGSKETAQALTDGAELTLFVWREFGERSDPCAIKGPSVSQVIADLRKAFK